MGMEVGVVCVSYPQLLANVSFTVVRLQQKATAYSASKKKGLGKGSIARSAGRQMLGLPEGMKDSTIDS